MKISRQAAGPLLITVWQPPIGRIHESLCVAQPIKRRETSPRHLRSNHSSRTRLSHNHGSDCIAHECVRTYSLLNYNRSVCLNDEKDRRSCSYMFPDVSEITEKNRL